MKNLSVFCLTLNPAHEPIIKKLGYIPVGLGKETFSKNCFSDKQDQNISKKNSFYGEYTFHYWIWKNYLSKITTEWVGFCQYRKFFLKENIKKDIVEFNDLKSSVISNVDTKIGNYDCILGKKFSVENYKFSKIIKHHLYEFLSNPSLIINKKKRNLFFHFDLFHGKGNLEKAINHLNQDDKINFKNFMLNNTSFNPHNMFVCKTEILKTYYDVIFPWLEKCESSFGFENLEGYGLKRIYGFLAERFMPYWFTKNYKIYELPIFVKDISDYKYL